jgi:hypothetical protein
VTATVAVTAPAAARRGGLTAFLGPIVAALIVGGKQAILVMQVRDGVPESSYLNGVHHIGTSAGLLLIAALRSRMRPAQAPA